MALVRTTELRNNGDVLAWFSRVDLTRLVCQDLVDISKDDWPNLFRWSLFRMTFATVVPSSITGSVGVATNYIAVRVALDSDIISVHIFNPFLVIFPISFLFYKILHKKPINLIYKIISKNCLIPNIGNSIVLIDFATIVCVLRRQALFVFGELLFWENNKTMNIGIDKVASSLPPTALDMETQQSHVGRTS